MCLSTDVATCSSTNGNRTAHSRDYDQLPSSKTFLNFKFDKDAIMKCFDYWRGWWSSVPVTSNCGLTDILPDTWSRHVTEHALLLLALLVNFTWTLVYIGSCPFLNDHIHQVSLELFTCLAQVFRPFKIGGNLTAQSFMCPNFTLLLNISVNSTGEPVLKMYLLYWF